MLIHIIRDGGDLRVGILPQLQDGHLVLGGVGIQELPTQAFPLRAAESVFQRIQVEGDREEKTSIRLFMGRDHLGIVPGQVGDHPVLIAPPFGKPGQVVEHPARSLVWKMWGPY